MRIVSIGLIDIRVAFHQQDAHHLGMDGVPRRKTRLGHESPTISDAAISDVAPTFVLV